MHEMVYTHRSYIGWYLDPDFEVQLFLQSILRVIFRLMLRAVSTMASISIATLPRLTNSALAALLLDPATASRVAVIDVRDNDYLGGHIRGGQNIITTDLDWKLPELVRTLQDKDVVVFHCMLSQQRGPSAALRYARKRLSDLGPDKGAVAIVGDEVAQQQHSNGHIQKVAVLTGGFEKWQEVYGEDERITEGFRKELWRDED